jgi:hypothetical protein
MITVTITDARQLAAVDADQAQHGSNFPDAATPEAYLQARVEEWLNSWADAYNVGTIFSADFVLRFTAEENAAITAAAATDELVAGFLTQVRATPTVRLYSDTVVQGLAYLVSQNLITQERADVILAY